MSQQLSLTSRATGRFLGLTTSILLVALGVALVIFSSEMAGSSGLIAVEGKMLLWVILAGGGFVVGTIGLMLGVFWCQSLARSRRRRARH